MEEVTQQTVKAAFPHGITVAQEGDAQNYNMVHVEVGEQDGKPTVLGWAYPNKDMLFFPEDLMVREDGDWTFHSEGRRYRFAPLSAEQSKIEKNMIAQA